MVEYQLVEAYFAISVLGMIGEGQHHEQLGVVGVFLAFALSQKRVKELPNYWNLAVFNLKLANSSEFLQT